MSTSMARIICQLPKPLYHQCTASRRLLSQVREFISSVSLEDKGLTVCWTSNHSAHLPYIFLRDNCQEKDSFDPTAKQRLFNPVFSVDLDIKAKSADLSGDGKQVTITWPDGHRSRYSSAWLKEHSEGTDDDTARLPVEQRLWKSNLFEEMTIFDFEKLMDEDGYLLEFLLRLDSYGLVMIDKMEVTSNPVKRLCDRISYPKPTVYGRGVMKIEKRPNPYHLTYSNHAVHYHTDMPYYSYCPGVQIFHCTEQLPGNTGSTHFCDGFNVAYALKERNPTAFEMLSQYPVHYAVVGKDYLPYKMEWWRLPISVNRSGRITDIHFSNLVRGTRYHSSLNGKLQEWYEAYYAFTHLCYSPEFTVEYKLQPGQMVVLDNLRILHGRPAFDSTDENRRCLELAYLDWDEIRSKARVLLDVQDKL